MLLALLACWFAGGPTMAAAAIDRIELHGDRIVVRLDPAVAGVVAAAPGRIEFDLARPAVNGSGALADDGGLVLALATTDTNPRLDSLPPFSWLRPASGTGGSAVMMAIPAASRRLALPPIMGEPGRPLVVIDAGHGGHDPGAIGADGEREKDVTLRIAKAIGQELIRSGRVRVALTRSDDRFLVLQERYGVARKLGASLFISVHCDSVGEGMATGASLYTLSEVASDKESARLAARENKADVIGGTDLADASGDASSILIDLTQRETMESSAEFARLLGREAQDLVPFKANYHRMASLLVLKAPDLPSILFETGYISNPQDLAFIDSPQGRDRIARGVRRAVEIYFARLAEPTPLATLPRPR